MKKNIIIPILLSLFIFVGCVEDLPTTSVVEIKPSSTYISLRSSQITLPDDGAEVESITLNSLRILVFDKTSGQIVTNKKFDIETVTAVEQTDGSWVADFSDFVAPTNPGQSVVYAVLNEDVSEVSGQSLKTFLDEVTTLTGMQTLVINTPLTYIPLRVVYDTTGKPIEPPFVMVAYDEFDIPANRPITDPFEADLRGLGGDSKGFTMNRTMAKVTLTSVSNRNIDGSDMTDPIKLSETSSIFILEMGLKNVPRQYFWTPSSFIYPLEPYNPALGYQDINFPRYNLNDPNATDPGYFERDWNGRLEIDFEAEVYESEVAKNTIIWYTGNGKGNGAYSIYRTSLDSLLNGLKNGSVSSEAFLSNYNNDSTQVVPIPNMNSGNFPSAVDQLYKNTSPTDFLPSDYKIEDPKSVTPNVIGATWTLKEKNISYYVPEHILVNSEEDTDATKLQIKAVKAVADLPDNLVEGEFTLDPNPIMGGWVYGDVYQNINISTAKPDEFTAYMNSKWKRIVEQFTYTAGKNKGQTVWIVRHYWEGVTRYRYGTITGKINNAEFQDITTSTITKEFDLPIRNNVSVGDPADYNIYRNNEYKFSVHVLEQWPLSAPSGAPSQSSTRSAWEDPNQSMVLRIVPE